MFSNILKIAAAIVIGFFVGLMSGSVIGVVLGLGVSLFFQEIVYSNHTILMSISLSVISGGLLGYFVTLVIKRFFETEDRPIAGAVAGAIAGFVVILFYGVISIPDPSVFDHTFYTIPLTYSVSVSSQIGSIIYPLFMVAAIIRDAVKSHIELRKEKARDDERKNELSFYKSNTSTDNEYKK